MGYRDARRYLDGRSEAGVARDWTATKMRDPGRAVAFVERWRGNGLWLEVRVELPDVDAQTAGPAAGWLAAPVCTVAHGVFDGSGYALTYASGRATYELALERTGPREGRATVRVDGSVVLETPVRREGLVRRVHATSADTLGERVGTTLRFLRTGRRRRAASR